MTDTETINESTTSQLEQIKGIRTDRYYNKLGQLKDFEDRFQTTEERTVVCGRFRAVYQVALATPVDSFGFDYWKGNCTYDTDVSFYEGEELLFVQKSKMVPCLVIHCLELGDQNKENTFFSIRIGYKLHIYNMGNEFVREACIGSDCLVDFKRVNQKYAIGSTEEMCTYSPFTGLFNLNDFFSQKDGDLKTKPYDNSRTHVPLRTDDYNYSVLRYFPLICTESGFLMEDLKDESIKKEIVSYDSVHAGDFDFDDEDKEDPNAKFYQMLVEAGFDMNKINEQVTQTGSAHILTKDIPKEIQDKYLGTS